MSTVRTNTLKNLNDTFTIDVEDLADANSVVSLADLASTTLGDEGGRLVGFKFPHASSIARNLQVKAVEHISVKDFGAVGDGIVDDTAAINAALVATKGVGDGYQTPISRRLYFPNGTYRVSNTLFVNNGHFLDGESAGGVIIKQMDSTKNTIEYFNEVTGIDTPLTIKRISVTYPTLAVTVGVTGIKVHSTTAASPVLEDVVVHQANDGFSFMLTINALLNRCYAIDCARDGFAFPESGGGLLNSVVVANACYAAGCGQDGWSGSVIGSTLNAVAGDRCGVGFNMKLLNSALIGSTESFASFGVQLTNSKESTVKMYAVSAVGGLAAFFLIDSTNIVLDQPTNEWAGGASSFTVTTSGTSGNITVINPSLVSSGSGIYSNKAIITEVSQGMRVGDTPNNTAQPFECGFSGGTGFGGSTHTSGFRTGTSTGYGVSMESWDAGSPRWGFYNWSLDTPSTIMEGSFLNTDVIFRHKPVLVSPNGTLYRLVVDNTGVLSTVLVV